MSNPRAATTPRRVTRQREAGAVTRRETRRRVLDAAALEFAERGYTGATVSRIADRADVAVPTLYSAWGSKRSLLRAVMERAVSNEEGGFADVDDRTRVLGPTYRHPTGDPVEFVGLLAHGYRELAERSAVGWRSYRDAAAVDADIAADWQELQLARRETFRQLLAKFPHAARRRGLTTEAAVDAAWAIASPETHELFVQRRGWSYDEYEAWVAATFTAVLVAPERVGRT